MSANTTNADVLKMLFGYNYEVLKTNLEGLTHEESLVQPQPAGNCLNWVLGHIVATRDAALEMLRQERVWNNDVATRYRRGSAPISDGSNAEPLEKIVVDLHRSQDRLVIGLADVTDQNLDQAAGDQTLGQRLFLLQFHEAYHAGQTGLLRRIAGHEGAIK